MKKLFSLLLAVILILPMGACSQEGGETMANYLYNGVELPELSEWPEWDKETYPYVYVSDGVVGGRMIYAVSNEDDIIQELRGVTRFVGRKYLLCYRYSTFWGTWNEQEVDQTVVNYVRTPVWANFTVRNEDGTVYLYPHPPILADSKLSVSVAQMMSYNGMELPELPEWDKETYPYAVICGPHIVDGYDGSYYSLIATNVLPEYMSSSGNVRFYVGIGKILKYYISEIATTAELADYLRTNGHPYAGMNFWGEVKAYEMSTNLLVSDTAWTNTDIYNSGGTTLYMAASDPVSVGICVTDTTAGIKFTCSDLLYTDTVYRIKAWCYPKGMDFWTAPVTWESDLFAGPNHSESVTFTGLLPDTEYEVYAVIYGAEGATEHNAHTTFTTAASEEETLEAVVMCNQVTENSFVAWLLAIGLDSSKEYTAVFEALENDETSAGSKTFTFSRSSVSQSCAFTGLKPNTDYVVYVDLYTEDRLVFSGECEVTTLEGEIPGGYDRDSFLLGFVSGLGCTAATKDGAEYNSWAQGYLAGCALRNAL